MAGGREGGSSVGGVGGGSGGLDTIPAENETNQAWLLLLNSLSFLIMDYCKKVLVKTHNLGLRQLILNVS